MENINKSKGRMVSISKLGNKLQGPDDKNLIESKQNDFKGSVTELPFIRCYSCGKVIGNLHEKYKKMLGQNMSPAEIFEALDLKRSCCRLRLANPSIIATAEYIEESDITKRKRKEEILAEAEEIINNELDELNIGIGNIGIGGRTTEPEKEKVSMRVRDIKARVKALQEDKKEAKKTVLQAPPKRTSHYFAT
jgi:DNA-directed RNA polymerase subunit N (RpoN/RPB10)